MLFGCSIRKWLEKMGVVSGSHFNRPSFHSRSNLVRVGSVKLGTILYRRKDSFICLLGHVNTHFVKIKYILTKILGNRSFFDEKSPGLMSSSLIQSPLSKCCHKFVINFVKSGAKIIKTAIVSRKNMLIFAPIF